jgi:eukaryotic-like serine/threonine-protein kinase
VGDPKEPAALAETLTRDSQGATEAATVRGGEPALKAGARLGRYFVLERLGGGGMGVVYVAFDPELNRKVAIKLMRPQASADGSDGAVRMLREAQAMARLSHPNVIPVYDVGEIDGRIFVAMELVDGSTLSAWCANRTWREIVARYIQAGRGLAAAHAVGLVHRDFKPDNVLVGNDGRVRVLDFGLARTAGEAAPATEPASPVPSTPDALDTPLTRPGALVGTPAYMAPEQLLSRPTEARSDQFSFCVSLYQALYGKRPFDGDTLPDLAYEIAKGRVREPPRSTRVPARIYRALRRGLSAEIDDRFPTMDALLAELEHDPAATRLRFAVAASVVALAVGAGLFAQRARHKEAALCRGAESRLAGVWSPARKQALHEAFRRVRVPYAEEAFRGASDALDRFAQAWVAMRTDACEATHVRGEQSAELLDLRMSCLEQRREQAQATIDLLLRADAKVLERAVRAADELGDLDGCANAVALRSRVRPPADAATRAKVDALRPRLAAVSATLDAGRWDEGLLLARTAADDAIAVGYKPLSAEALWLRGDLERRTGDAKKAERTLNDALADAEAGRDDSLAARILASLVGVVGFDAGRHEQGLALAHQAEAFVERSGSDDRLLAHVLNNRANILADQGKFDEALADYRRSLAIREKVLAKQHPDTAMSHNNIGTVLVNKGQHEEALVEFQIALAMREQVLGREHPEVAMSLQNIATALDGLRRYQEELPYFERALAIYERTVGKDHPDVATAHQNMAGALVGMGKYAEAIEQFQITLAMREKSLGPDHPYVAEVECSIGEAMWYAKDYAHALEHHRRALAMSEKAQEPNNPTLSCALTGVGRDLLSQHHAAAAIAPLERALTLREKGGGDAVFVAMTQFALAEALVALGKDRARALELAGKAQKSYLQGGAAWQKEGDEVASWLKAQGASVRGGGPTEKQ